MHVGIVRCVRGGIAFHAWRNRSNCWSIRCCKEECGNAKERNQPHADCVTEGRGSLSGQLRGNAPRGSPTENRGIRSSCDQNPHARARLLHIKLRTANSQTPRQNRGFEPACDEREASALMMGTATTATSRLRELDAQFFARGIESIVGCAVRPIPWCATGCWQTNQRAFA